MVTVIVVFKLLYPAGVIEVVVTVTIIPLPAKLVVVVANPINVFATPALSPVIVIGSILLYLDIIKLSVSNVLSESKKRIVSLELTILGNVTVNEPDIVLTNNLSFLLD